MKSLGHHLYRIRWLTHSAACFLVGGSVVYTPARQGRRRRLMWLCRPLRQQRKRSCKWRKFAKSLLTVISHKIHSTLPLVHILTGFGSYIWYMCLVFQTMHWSAYSICMYKSFVTRSRIIVELYQTRVNTGIWLFAWIYCRKFSR